MTVSSRTPEGEPHHCAICGAVVVTEPSEPLGDSLCPRCGALLIRLRDSLRTKIGDAVDHLAADTSIAEEMGLDSLETVELVMEWEERFGVEFTDDDAEHIQTLGDAIRYLLKRKRELGEELQGDNP